MNAVNGDVTINEGGFWCFAGCSAFCGLWCTVGGGIASFTMANLGIAGAYHVN